MVYVYILVCVCISISDLVWFTVLPGLSNRLQAEPAGRSWLVQARLDFAAPQTVHTHTDTVCFRMEAGQAQEHARSLQGDTLS